MLVNGRKCGGNYFGVVLCSSYALLQEQSMLVLIMLLVVWAMWIRGQVPTMCPLKGVLILGGQWNNGNRRNCWRSDYSSGTVNIDANTNLGAVPVPRRGMRS